jgi:nucleoside-diphosphate-sugar epimerase
VSEQQVDAVVHAAALAHVRPEHIGEGLCHAINVDGARNVAAAAAAAGVKRFVFISSTSVYGEAELPACVDESYPARAIGLYGRSKADAEAACSGYGDRMGVTILRMASMYDADWLFNVRKRVAPPVIGRWCYFTLRSKEPRYSLCSRSNGSAAVLHAVDGRLSPSVYNVADDYVYRQADILRAVRRTEGRKAILPIPSALPSAMLALARMLAPGSEMERRARERYWKFCERNVYSPAKLVASGLSLAPELLDLGATRAPSISSRT